MIKYAKIIDDTLKTCMVGVGTNGEFYKSIGMQEMDVEQAYGGNWYVSRYAPKQPLEELKLIKRAEVNRARDKKEQGGFAYLGKVFDSDSISCQRISCAAQAFSMADDSATIVWTCQDNSTIELNKAQLLGLVVALAQHSNACHEEATEIKKKIDAAQTIEELETISL